jgi:hypothetical protein
VLFNAALDFICVVYNRREWGQWIVGHSTRNGREEEKKVEIDEI